MRFGPICALLSLLVPAASFASDARPAKPEMKLKIPAYELGNQVFDFPTGLRIVMQSDRSHPVATTWMIINHGTKDDPKGKEETAHFVEHTWFRSKHGSLPEIMNLIQDIGTRFNATTRNDWTDYRTVASSEYLPLLLRLESLRLTEPYAGVTEDEIDVEREVIRNEWRRRNEQNIAQLFDFVYESVYPENHGYHDHSTHESIDNIKLADLQGFMDDYYTPENTTIFVVGDFDPQEAASLIFENFAPELLHPGLKKEHYFQHPKPGIETPDQNNPNHWLWGAYDPNNPTEPFPFSTREAPRVTEDRPPVPPLGTAEVVTKEAPVTVKTLAVAWSLPGAFRADHWNLVMVGNMATQYVFEGLYDDIDAERIGDFGCFSQPEVLNTTVMCIVELVDKKLDPIRVRDRVLDQFASMWNPENFSGATLNAQLYNSNLTRAKMEAMSDMLLDLDVFAQEFGGRGESITPHIHYTNSVMATAEGMQQIMAIDPNVISTLASDYLKRNRAATVILEPLPEEEIDVGSESSTYRGANATDQVLSSADDLTTMTDEQIADSYVTPNLETLQDFQLPNGLRVVVLEHGEAPLVEVSLVLRRDLSKEPHGMLDFAAAFARGPGNDTLPIAANQNWWLYAGIPGLSGSNNPDLPAAWTQLPYSRPFELEPGNVAGNMVRMGIRAPSGNLDGVLWILREEIEGVKPFIDSKNRYLDDQKDDVKAGWKSRDWHLDAARSAYLYPDAAWRQPISWEDVEQMSSWGNTQIDAWLNAELQPANATLMVVGNIDVKEAKELATKYFGGWKPRGSAEAPSVTPVTPGMPDAPSKVLIYDDAKRTQTDLTTSCRLNVTDRSQEYAVEVLGSLLRNRTFTQMRVKEGLAYSPGAFAAIDSDGSAALTFYSDGVVNSGVQRMLTFFNEAIDEVEAGNVDGEEITLNKLRRSRSAGVSAQSISQMTNHMVQVLRNGETWDAMTKRGERIASVSADDMKGLVEGCKEHSITTLVGPKEVITPQLDELGVEYEIVQYRADGDELLWKHDPKAAKKQEKERQKAEKKKAKEDKKKEKSGEATGDEAAE
jgi:zinc protease